MIRAAIDFAVPPSRHLAAAGRYWALAAGPALFNLHRRSVQKDQPADEAYRTDHAEHERDYVYGHDTSPHDPRIIFYVGQPRQYAFRSYGMCEGAHESTHSGGAKKVLKLESHRRYERGSQQEYALPTKGGLITAVLTRSHQQLASYLTQPSYETQIRKER